MLCLVFGLFQLGIGSSGKLACRNNNKMFMKRLSIGFLCLAGFLAVFPAAKAQDSGDTVQFKVLGGYTYDSNVFRLSSDEIANILFGSPETSDKILYYGAGVTVRVPKSRQLFIFEATPVRYEYDRFDFLDNTGGDARAEWDWGFGRLWLGDVGYKYNKALAGFENRRTIQKSIRTTQAVYGSAQYRFHLDWSAIVRLRADERDYSLESDSSRNRKRQTSDLEFRYFNASRSFLGGRLRVADNYFPDRTLNQLTDTGFVDTELSLTMRIEPTGRSKLEGNVGYLDRTYDNLGAQDLDGFTYRLLWEWLYSDKLFFDFSVWRDLDPVADADTENIIRDGISIDPVWLLTSKMSLRAELKYEIQDYERISSTQPARKDKVSTLGLTLGYQALDFLTLTFGAKAQDRTSDQPIDEYDYNSLSIGLEMVF